MTSINIDKSEVKWTGHCHK